MSDREHVLWSALYAAAWFHLPADKIGVVTDEARATAAAREAYRGIAALKLVKPDEAK